MREDKGLGFAPAAHSALIETELLALATPPAPLLVQDVPDFEPKSSKVYTNVQISDSGEAPESGRGVTDAVVQNEPT